MPNLVDIFQQNVQTSSSSQQSVVFSAIKVQIRHKCPPLNFVYNLRQIDRMGLMFPIYFISLVVSAGMSLMTLSQILDLSDLDCDYINPQQCCAKLNRLVIPEMLLVGLLVTLHLLTLNWIPTATFMPILAWLIYSYKSDRRGYVNLYDATTISNQSIINKHVRRNLFRAVHYIVHFVGFMYMAVLDINTV